MDTFRAADLPDPEELVSARRAVLQEAKVRGRRKRPCGGGGGEGLVRFFTIDDEGHSTYAFIISYISITPVL